MLLFPGDEELRSNGLLSEVTAENGTVLLTLSDLGCEVARLMTAKGPRPPYVPEKFRQVFEDYDKRREQRGLPRAWAPEV